MPAVRVRELVRVSRVSVVGVWSVLCRPCRTRHTSRARFRLSLRRQSGRVVVCSPDPAAHRSHSILTHWRSRVRPCGPPLGLARRSLSVSRGVSHSLSHSHVTHLRTTSRPGKRNSSWRIPRLRGAQRTPPAQARAAKDRRYIRRLGTSCSSCYVTSTCTRARRLAIASTQICTHTLPASPRRLCMRLPCQPAMPAAFPIALAHARLCQLAILAVDRGAALLRPGICPEPTIEPAEALKSTPNIWIGSRP